MTYFSFGTSFATNGLVDTYTINAWCRKLSLDNRPKDSKVHHFFHLISVSAISFLTLLLFYYFFALVSLRLVKMLKLFCPQQEHQLLMDSYETQELYDQKSSMVQRCFQLANGARLIHTCDEVNIVKCIHF